MKRALISYIPGFTHRALPEKMSELIRVALVDMEIVERNPAYKIDMGTWHAMGGEGVCEVCFAGAVMAQTMNVRPTRVGTGPSSFEDRLGNKFRALNALREGEVWFACEFLGVPYPSGMNRSIADYHSDKTRFKRDMRKLADDLEEAGQ